MAARLILNSDDFGLTRGINRAIAELHTAGCLTSATLMANGPAFDDAVATARAHPTLRVGCHIVLVDGTPISDPTTLPTLCPNGRTLRPSLLDFLRDLLLHRIDPTEIQREALAQFHKIERAGIRVTHFDTHKHTHLFPPVAAQLSTILKRCEFVALRNPFEPTFAQAAAAAPLKRRIETTALRCFKPSWKRATSHVQTTDGTLGITATGTLNALTLRNILASLPASGTYELLCHPGYNDADLDAQATRLRASRELEYRTLLEVIPEYLSGDSRNPAALELIHYGNLGVPGLQRASGQYTRPTGFEKVL